MRIASSRRVAIRLSALVVLSVWIGYIAVATEADQRGLGRIEADAVQHRLALVIGNSAYAATPLRNPVNDATAIAKALREFGFEVIERHDADRRQMRQALREFADTLRQQRGVGLFYYAGHGVQVNGRNYLIPVGADIRREFEVPDEALDARSVLRAMRLADNGLNIVILDACRNNPFARSFRSVTEGLARMDAPTGSLIAYATAPGRVARDGPGEHGLYTAALLKHVREPGRKVEDVLKQVRLEVRRATGGEQVPWESTSLVGDFYFKRAPKVDHPTASAPPKHPPLYGPVDPMAVELAYWESIRESDNPALLQAYLARYPGGTFVDIAKFKLSELKPTPTRLESQDEDKDSSAQTVVLPGPAPTTPPVSAESPSERPYLSPKESEKILNLSRQRRREAQLALTLLGFDTKGFDGIFGRYTRAAISRFQDKHSFETTGYFTSEQVDLLFNNAREPLAKWKQKQARQAAAKEKRRKQQAELARRARARAQRRAAMERERKKKLENRLQEKDKRKFGNL